MAEDRSGFLGRWSRRKLDARQGRALDEPTLADNARAAPVAGAGVAAPQSGPAAFAPAVSAPTPATAAPWRATDQAGAAPSSAPVIGPACKSAAAPTVQDANAPAPAKALSLEDVKALTQDSDFKPFMVRHVGADVRNAAMKKLFADPHYNVMDGLDIYIDDYTIADPLPQAMLRQMASAKFLNLFDDEEGDKSGKNATARTVQEGAAAQADVTPTSADECLKNPDLQNLSQPDVQSLSQPDAQSLNQSDVPSLAQRDAQNLTQTETDTAAQSSEPLTPASADFISYLSPDHASQPEPAASSGASQDHHAHSHLRLQPDHAAPAPNAGRGA